MAKQRVAAATATGSTTVTEEPPAQTVKVGTLKLKAASAGKKKKTTATTRTAPKSRTIPDERLTRALRAYGIVVRRNLMPAATLIARDELAFALTEMLESETFAEHVKNGPLVITDQLLRTYVQSG
jgi:hypothetical protein